MRSNTLSLSSRDRGGADGAGAAAPEVGPGVGVVERLMPAAADSLLLLLLAEEVEEEVGAGTCGVAEASPTTASAAPALANEAASDAPYPVPLLPAE
jgi:hypothetical protein